MKPTVLPPKINRILFATTLCDTLEDAGWSQTDAADNAGIPQPALSVAMGAKRAVSVNTVLRLCRALPRPQAARLAASYGKLIAMPHFDDFVVISEVAE